jgi:hypothetical protein
VPETLEIVSADVAGFAPGVTSDGENEQLHPLGRPEQDNDTALLKAPCSGVAVTVRFPDCPEISNDEGEVLKLTVGGGPCGAHDGV